MDKWRNCWHGIHQCQIREGNTEDKRRIAMLPRVRYFAGSVVKNDRARSSLRRWDLIISGGKTRSSSWNFFFAWKEGGSPSISRYRNAFLVSLNFLLRTDIGDDTSYRERHSTFVGALMTPWIHTMNKIVITSANPLFAPLNFPA